MLRRLKQKSAFRHLLLLLVSAVTALGLTGGLSATASAERLSGPMDVQGMHHFYTLKYVALGDSVAAGLGLPADPNASEEDIACGRSVEAYSRTVADRINDLLGHAHLQLDAQNVACQGAVVTNLAEAQPRGELTIQPQLDAAFADGTPTLLTLTMGANDIRWADFISGCFSAANCNTESNTALATALINTMKADLSNALRDIRSRSNFLPPVVVVTGYYQPISAQCASANLTADEITWLQDRTNDFNNALRDTTRDRNWFTRFAPVDFTGHDICSADSWIQRPGVPGEPAPFHPTARGQQAIAESVLRSIGLR